MSTSIGDVSVNYSYTADGNISNLAVVLKGLSKTQMKLNEKKEKKFHLMMMQLAVHFFNI